MLNQKIMVLVRLNKFLSNNGICSRREADEHILAGEVYVNGQAANLGQIIDPEKDRIEFRGKVINRKDNLVYYALYKPRGVISTASDERGRQSVVDLVPKEPRVYPVGRLDADSEGLIVLTNDGDLAQKLTHPSFEHEKEYWVRVESEKLKVKSVGEIKRIFEAGIIIDGKIMKADKVYNFQDTFNSQPFDFTQGKLSSFNLILHTGYNRQIRRMCAKIGLEVKQLVRVRIAKLDLAELKLASGEYKKITKNQII